MRITDRYQSLMDRVSTGATRAIDKTEKSDAGARTAPKRALLEVNVSDRAQELASGAARVEQLRASVRDGTFKIDARAIAARLVGEDEGG